MYWRPGCSFTREEYPVGGFLSINPDGRQHNNKDEYKLKTEVKKNWKNFDTRVGSIYGEYTRYPGMPESIQQVFF